MESKNYNKLVNKTEKKQTQIQTTNSDWLPVMVAGGQYRGRGVRSTNY